MPSLFNIMTDAKDTTTATPVVITQMAADVAKPRNTKKIVIIAVSAILSVAIILAAILVGMYMFTQAQKDILKYTVNVDKDTKEEVTADQNENVVQYHVQNANYEMWVVDDFNRDIEMLKIQTNSETNCYVLPLNRTSATDPSKVKTPSKFDVKQNATERLFYDVASSPISDPSFLGKMAKKLCKGISVYWMYPKCGDELNGGQRQKRGICYRCYIYYYWYNGVLYYRYVCYYVYC
jgi:uncharacterized protein YxeA